jgi:type II secretory pathway pseudopilin PulG
MRSGDRRRSGGFTYLGVLFLVLLIGLALSAAGEVTRTAIRREHEQELLYAGHQYREAIARFYAQVHRYPATLDELTGYATGDGKAARFLRRLYPDPMTRDGQWTLVETEQGGIKGVASTSQAVPLKRAGFDPADAAFEEAEKYADWQFVFEPRGRWPGRPPARPNPPQPSSP